MKFFTQTYPFISALFHSHLTPGISRAASAAFSRVCTSVSRLMPRPCLVRFRLMAKVVPQHFWRSNFTLCQHKF